MNVATLQHKPSHEVLLNRKSILWSRNIVFVRIYTYMQRKIFIYSYSYDAMDVVQSQVAFNHTVCPCITLNAPNITNYNDAFDCKVATYVST